MRILLLTPGAYGVNGGIALYNRDVIEALDAVPEVQRIVVLPREIKLPAEPMPRKVDFVREAAGGQLRFIQRALLAMVSRCDLVLCGHVNLLPLAVMAAKRSAVPLVLVTYGIEVWAKPKRSIDFWLKHVDAIWTISEVTRDRMNEWAALRADLYTILPNAIHLDRYGMNGDGAALRTKHGLDGRKILLTLARLPGFDRYKGVDEVLECLPELTRREPEICYVVVGEGEDRPRLEQKARTLGVADRVIFTGFVADEDKADYYRMADAFVLPGRGEGFGFVFLEALACGIPAVGSLIDGSREALRHGQLGELVDPRDIGKVREAIDRVLAKPKGIPAGLEYFAWPAFRERIDAALRAVMRREIA